MPTVIGIVERFPGDDGWWYVVVPDDIVAELGDSTSFAMVPVRAVLEGTQWDTSIMRSDDFSFVAIKAAIRARHGVEAGDEVSVELQPR